MRSITWQRCLTWFIGVFAIVLAVSLGNATSVVSDDIAQGSAQQTVVQIDTGGIRHIAQSTDTSSTQAALAPATFTVQRNNTLSGVFGDAWRAVYDKNKALIGPNPGLIQPGQVLDISGINLNVAVPLVAHAAASAPVPVPASAKVDTVWDRLAQCEAGGNWSINTGNGFYGGLQFTLSSWRAVGGSGYPHQASRGEQILRGQKLQALQGWGAWPTCSSKLGLR